MSACLQVYQLLLDQTSGEGCQAQKTIPLSRMPNSIQTSPSFPAFLHPEQWKSQAIIIV